MPHGRGGPWRGSDDWATVALDARDDGVPVVAPTPHVYMPNRVGHTRSCPLEHANFPRFSPAGTTRGNLSDFSFIVIFGVVCSTPRPTSLSHRYRRSEA